MKKRNKGKKALTAVGAVVAAGLTPGFIAATPGCLPHQASNAGFTAADVITIDGNTYSFEELYAMQHPDSVETNVIELNIVLEPDSDYVPDRIVMAYGVPKYGVPRDFSVNTSKPKTKSEPYRSVEQMPQFPGGDAALMKYIESHIQYPANAISNKVEGHVVVQFVVEKTGAIGEVKVVRSVDKDLDREAIRVCKSLPKFAPGRQNGKAVSVWYTLPVTFTLPKENND